jgi:hypothetical protein
MTPRPAPRPRRRFALALAPAALAGLLILALAGCDDDDPPREPAFHEQTQRDPNADTREVHALIGALANGKDPDDPKASAAYDEAKAKLVRQGGAIENDLIDALRSNHDWGVRLGCIEVLQAVGGKACVDHLIATVLDDVPLVAFQAEKTLEVMTDHQVIPPAGAPTSLDGVPPIPARAPNDLAMDAELRIWSAWQQQYKQPLHDAWTAWWKENKGKTKVE